MWARLPRSPTEWSVRWSRHPCRRRRCGSFSYPRRPTDSPARSRPAPSRRWHRCGASRLDSRRDRDCGCRLNTRRRGRVGTRRRACTLRRYRLRRGPRPLRPSRRARRPSPRRRRHRSGARTARRRIGPRDSRSRPSWYPPGYCPWQRSGRRRRAPTRPRRAARQRRGTRCRSRRGSRWRRVGTSLLRRNPRGGRA